MNKTLVYFKKGNLQPKGGPAAVCFYYNEEKEKRQDDFFEFLPSSVSTTKTASHSLLSKLLLNIKIYIKTITLLFFPPKFSEINFSKYDVIHFHSTKDLFIERKSIKDFKGKILLQSHSPQPLAQEILASAPWCVRYLIPFVRKRYEEMDKYAFLHADRIIFPCSDAEEPYFNTWSYYKELKAIKKESYRYLLTGIPSCCASKPRDEVRASLSIPSDHFVISYVGRHNNIKGYDVLKEVAEKVLNEDKATWVVVAGKEYPLTRYVHPRWIEVGWTTEAHSYIGASDVFVLPNRETYFDIVMIEILSLGKMVVASRTGGNRLFEKQGCSGVFLYDTKEECINILNRIKKMSNLERDSLGKLNRMFYEKNLTSSVMYDNYIQLLTEIRNE